MQRIVSPDPIQHSVLELQTRSAVSRFRSAHLWLKSDVRREGEIRILETEDLTLLNSSFSECYPGYPTCPLRRPNLADFRSDTMTLAFHPRTLEDAGFGLLST
jgi:hypothetical protein